MTNNEIFLSLGAGLCIFIIITAYKKSKNETIDRNETAKLSLVISAIVFGILLVYNKPMEPVLAEPFITSSIPEPTS
jgi:hypothetical protein